MAKIKDGNYIVIQSFMINELELKGNELLVYAIIYNFSQDGEQKYTGSLQYLANWTNSTKQGVLKNLKSLIDKGYIEREENVINGVKFVKYYSTEFNRGIKQSLMGGIKQSLTNNIDINNINNNIKEKEIKRKVFEKPTIEEIQQYCSERNNGINANTFYDFYESKNWYVGKNKMQNWKACVRTWEQRSEKKKVIVPSWLNQEIKERSLLTDEERQWAKSIE